MTTAQPDHSAARGGTVWLTGLPSAGKSTVADAVAEPLRAAGRPVEVLDGDAVRPYLSAGLGYSREDRDANIARIGWVAALLARHGVLVLVAVVSPYAGARDKVRRLHEEQGLVFVEVHVATPLEVCAERDVKGLYAKQQSGEMTGLTGVDDPYEPPASPEIVLVTHDRPVADSAADLRAALRERGLL